MRAVSTITTHIVQSDDTRYLTAKPIERERQRIEREQQRIERDQQQIEREQRRIERLCARTRREQLWIEIDQQLIENARKRIEPEQQRARVCAVRVERDQNVLDLRDLGFTMQEIGDQLGITHQRVHQIIKREEQSGQARAVWPLRSRTAKFADIEAWEAERTRINGGAS